MYRTALQSVNNIQVLVAIAHKIMSFHFPHLIIKLDENGWSGGKVSGK